MTQIFHYTTSTGEYCGTTVARRDPLDGNALVPAGATTIAPPEGRHRESAVWNGVAWEIVPDFRGYVYWTEDGTKHEIQSLDEVPPQGALSEAPPPKPSDLEGRIQQEAEKRISEIAGEGKRTTLAASLSLGILDEKETAAYRMLILWMKDMRQKAALLSKSGSISFQQDHHWPDAPASITELLGSY
ncbi:hypothetical protein ACMA5I_06510 [Paracoccaceae bacterium GXU_MW_L88]